MAPAVGNGFVGSFGAPIHSRLQNDATHLEAVSMSYFDISRHTPEHALSLNVSLPPELENRVRQHVESGLYSSASEVIREALRLFEAYQSMQAANLASLKADIALGVADIETGRVRELDMHEIKQRGRATLAAR